MRALRLRALADAPDAFDTTLERERSRPVAEWRTRLARDATFVLEAAGEAVGMAGGVPHSDDPSVALLVGLWVHPAHRGRGGADALGEAVLAWAERSGFREVRLHVGRHNGRARRLYDRLGFRATGDGFVRPQDGRFEDEMMCPLPRGPAGS